MPPSPNPLAGQAVSRFPHERLGDAELVQALAQGDTEAISVVWDRYAQLVRGVLRVNLGVDSAVEDLLQEVFIILLQNAAEIRTGGALKGFLKSTAVRVVLVELRRRRVRRWVTLTDTGDVPDKPVTPRDSEGAAALNGLYRLLDRMPPRRRIAFMLRQVEGFELAEVASSLGISVSTAKREVQKARDTIFARAERAEPELWHYLSNLEGEQDA